MYSLIFFLLFFFILLTLFLISLFTSNRTFWASQFIFFILCDLLFNLSVSHLFNSLNYKSFFVMKVYNHCFLHHLSLLLNRSAEVTVLDHCIASARNTTFKIEKLLSQIQVTKYHSLLNHDQRIEELTCENEYLC